VIVVLQKGKIVEQGKHEELMAIEEGHYRGLVRLQTMPGAEGGKEGGMSRTSSTASFGSGMGSRATSSTNLNGTAATAAAAAGAAATVAAANEKMSSKKEKKKKEEEEEEEEVSLISPKKPRSHNNITAPSSVVVKSSASDDIVLDKIDKHRLWNLSRPEWKWVGLALIMYVLLPSLPPSLPPSVYLLLSHHCSLTSPPSFPPSLPPSLLSFRAVVNGCTFPAYSFLLSNIVSYLYDPDPHVVREKAFFWAGIISAFSSPSLPPSLPPRTGTCLS